MLYDRPNLQTWVTYTFIPKTREREYRGGEYK